MFVAVVLTNDRGGDLTTSMQATAYVLLLAPIVGLAATIKMRAAKGIFQTSRLPRLSVLFCSRRSAAAGSWHNT